MARTTSPQCKLCRREGEKLFLKGERCETVKCSLSRRKYGPGQKSWGRRKISKYGTQFREKQKLKRFYGVLEKQFNTYFKKATRRKTNTGEYLLQLMERRLDNVVHLLLFASSRKQARQLISHGHISVNGGKVDIASCLVKVGDVIKLTSNESVTNLTKANVENSGKKIPQWLESGGNDLEGRVAQLPAREDVSIEVQEQFVVEVCSR
ncbi:MAG: 30S ribosomal protein S4 [Candidatus Anammoxibacter sp.]